MSVTRDEMRILRSDNNTIPEDIEGENEVSMAASRLKSRLNNRQRFTTDGTGDSQVEPTSNRHSSNPAIYRAATIDDTD